MSDVAIIKCKNNHYYDDKKYEKCPYCGGERRPDEGALAADTQSIIYRDINRKENNQLTQSYDIEVSENQKTISKFEKNLKNNPTAGWFVCIKGSQYGKSFEIKTGRNFVGRSLKSDIVISDDKSISRENHFSVIFDSKSKIFYLIPGQGPVYLKGDYLDNPKEIKENDEVTLGDTVLKFVPYCMKGREWE